MTYNATEVSSHSGSPIELYEFRRFTQTWYYTSADEDLFYDNRTYTAIPITRSKVEQTTEQSKNRLTVTAVRTIDVAELFRVAPPSDVVTLTVRRFHYLDGDQQAVTIWSGRVLNVEWSTSEVTFSCEPVFTSLKRTGLRRMYQRACPHVLFSSACGANRDLHRVDGAVLAVNGNTLDVQGLSSQAEGFYAGGYVSWEVTPGINETRFIQSHVGTTITLNVAFATSPLGETVTVYPGCDHTLSTCDSKFSNSANYGGMPYIPLKNPFGGVDGPVY